MNTDQNPLNDLLDALANGDAQLAIAIAWEECYPLSYDGATLIDPSAN